MASTELPVSSAGLMAITGASTSSQIRTDCQGSTAATSIEMRLRDLVSPHNPKRNMYHVCQDQTRHPCRPSDCCFRSRGSPRAEPRRPQPRVRTPFQQGDRKFEEEDTVRRLWFAQRSGGHVV